MQLIYTLQIFGVGTGSDTSLGLFDGSLKLATAPLSGYLNGVLDYKEIGDIQSSINIIEGGQLGGPTGTVSLKVRSQAIAAALNSGVLAINGKLLQIRVHPVGGTPQLLYTGTVSNSFVPDTLTIDITSASAYELDTKDVPCITVTKDMALGDASSGAIGKVLVPTYGAKVSYPLINLEPSTDAAAVAVFSSVYEDDTKVLQANAPKRQVGSPAVVTPSGEQIGVTLMIPAAAWQQAEAMPVWVALSVNGKEMLFAEASESYADLLRSQLLGKVLIAVRGKGKGTRYTIKALEYASHAGAATIWVQLDTTDIASIKAAKPYSVSSTDGLGAYRADTKYDAKASTDTIVAAYENGSIVDDLTHFAFTRAANIYLVHGDCVSPSGIYTVKDGIKQDIPGVKIVEIHRGDRWALIRIDAAHDSEGFQVDNLIGLETFLLDDSEAFNGLYANDGSVRDTVANNDQVPTGGLALECSTITPGFGVTADQVLTNYCTTFSRIEDLVDGKELSKDWTVLATPSASLYISGAWSLTYPQRATIQVQVATVGEGNVTLGSVTTEHVARFKGVPAMSVDIRPDLGAILFGAGCISHEATSTSAYRALVEGLDISDLLSAGTVKRVRGIVCTVRLRVDAYGYEHAYYTAVARKTIRPLALNLGRKVAFTDTLYASAIWGSSINSPASLCREIATKNGITVDTASFTASDNYMQGLLGGKAYEGTYTPSAGESLSSVLQTIARASGLGLYTDAQGVLHCVSLWEGAEAPVYEFGGTSLVDGSLSLSTSDTGYMSSSFSFEYVTSPYSTKLSAYIDAGTDTLPAEDDYQTGSLTYAQSNGYGVQVYDYDAGWGRVRIRAPLASADMLAPFVQGTTWELQTLTGTPRRRWIRVDSVAPDLLAPAWEQGVWIGYSVLHSEDITAPAEVL